MNKQYKNIFLFSFIILLMIMSFSCKKEEKQSSILQVQTVIGDVTIKSGDTVSTPVIGTMILENSIIKTGKLSIVDIKYKDSGVIRINENSNVNVARLFSTDKSDETILKMEEGKVFVTVSKLFKDSKMQVKTPTSVAGIRGTSFRVSAEKDGVSRVDVLAGKVKVNPVKDEKVIESIEKIVETNKTIEMDQKAVENIVEKKKDIKIVALQKEEIETIKEEAKFIKIDNTLNEEIKNEIKEIGIETKPVEQIKDEKEYQQELIKQLEKVQEGREAELKEKEKEKEKAEKAALAEEQKKKDAEARREKVRLQRLEKERIEREKKEELVKQQQIKEEKKKENTVKNIPNF